MEKMSDRTKVLVMLSENLAVGGKLTAKKAKKNGIVKLGSLISKLRTAGYLIASSVGEDGLLQYSLATSLHDKRYVYGIVKKL